MRDALESVACPSRPELSTFDYWKGREHHKLVETCHNDTLVTREALSKLGQKSPDKNDLAGKKDHIFSQEKVRGDDINSKEKMRMDSELERKIVNAYEEYEYNHDPAVWYAFEAGYLAAINHYVPKLCPTCGCNRTFSGKACKACSEKVRMKDPAMEHGGGND
jgi:hypothetical protein